MSKQSIITGEVLLLCERVEMAQFMHAYLQHLFKQGISLPNMQILNYQSIDKLDLLTKRLIQLEGREIVQKAVFFADAADERERRMQKFFAEEKQKTLRRYQILNERTFSFPAKKLLNVGKRVILRICCCSRCGWKARSAVIIIICII